MIRRGCSQKKNRLGNHLYNYCWRGFNSLSFWMRPIRFVLAIRLWRHSVNPYANQCAQYPNTHNYYAFIMRIFHCFVLLFTTRAIDLYSLFYSLFLLLFLFYTCISFSLFLFSKPKANKNDSAKILLYVCTYMYACMGVWVCVWGVSLTLTGFRVCLCLCCRCCCRRWLLLPLLLLFRLVRRRDD